MNQLTQAFFSDELQKCIDACQRLPGNLSLEECERLCTGKYLRMVFQSISETAQQNNIPQPVLMEAFRSELEIVFNIKVTFHSTVGTNTFANGA